MTLGWILGASVAGGALSVALAAFSLYLRASWIPMLVSFAIGTLLGAAFLEVIPHAFDQGDAQEAALAILGGIFGFFVLEKLMLWRHCHTEDCEAHDPHGPATSAHAHDHGRSGALIIVGDTIHNFVDGVLIAAAFMQSTELGIVAAVAIIAHEIPQEVGDFLILLHSGFSKRKALLMNMLSGLATVVGALIAYFALSHVTVWIPEILAVAAASMIYIAVADLIPGLHRRTALSDTLVQVSFIGLGIALIWIIHAALEV
jgi:zinc and cadmium transporter